MRSGALSWVLALFAVASFLFLAASADAKESKTTVLPTFTIESNRNRILHVLAYMRDYSSLASYTDTVYLFREKLVDYMILPNKKVKFEGWTEPRTILSRSYYRFTDAQGLDSVSSECVWHFSWTDWMGLPPLEKLPANLSFDRDGRDTVFGKYSPCIIWDKTGDRARVDVNVLAAPSGREWCPQFDVFFRRDVDFDSFKISFNYDNVLGYDLSPADITAYTYSIESNGRGHELQRIFPLNRGPIYVTTVGEVYVLDREFLTPKEAKVWKDFKYDDEDVSIFEPADAPPLSPEILALISRVEAVNKGDVRVSLPPDERMVSIYWGKRKQNLGDRMIQLFKQLTGITLIKSRKQARNTWESFKKEQIRRNQSQPK